MVKPVKHEPEAVIQAIEGSGGIKTVIAQRLGVTRRTVDNYLKRWTSAKQAYDAETEINADVAESVVITNIKLAAQRQRTLHETVDSSDAKWYLTKKGKRRGYSDSLNVNNIDFSKLSDEQLGRIANGEDVVEVILSNYVSGSG